MTVLSDAQSRLCILLILIVLSCWCDAFAPPSCRVDSSNMATGKVIHHKPFSAGNQRPRIRLSMKLVPVSGERMKILFPRSVTPAQWRAYWGTTPLETVQRIMESVLFAYGGAWIAWFLSFMAGDFISSIAGSIMIFNWMVNPYLAARRQNHRIRYSDDNRRLYHALFQGRIGRIRRIRRRSGKTIGQYSQEYLDVLICDEDGRELEIITPWRTEYLALRQGMTLETLVASTNRVLSDVYNVAEALVPACDLWIGDYPYVNKSYFRKLSRQLLSSSPSATYFREDGNDGPPSDGGRGKGGPIPVVDNNSPQSQYPPQSQLHTSSDLRDETDEDDYSDEVSDYVRLMKKQRNGK